MGTAGDGQALGVPSESNRSIRTAGTWCHPLRRRSFLRDGPLALELETHARDAPECNPGGSYRAARTLGITGRYAKSFSNLRGLRLAEGLIVRLHLEDAAPPSDTVLPRKTGFAPCRCGRTCGMLPMRLRDSCVRCRR